VTYRAAPHATADDPRAYIDLERVEQEKQNECLGRYERYLRRLGVLGDELEAEIKAEAAETMRAGITAAEAEPDPDPELLFDHAYVIPPPNLREGLGNCGPPGGGGERRAARRARARGVGIGDGRGRRPGGGSF